MQTPTPLPEAMTCDKARLFFIGETYRVYWEQRAEVRELSARRQREYLDSCSKWCAKRGIPLDLFLALLARESNFCNKVFRENDGSGITQITPACVRYMDDKYAGMSDEQISTIMLADPDEAIRLSTKFLRYLLDKYGGEEYAIRIYNVGERGYRKHVNSDAHWRAVQDQYERLSMLEELLLKINEGR